MNQRLVQVALLVKDYDEAINYYVNTLGFELIENTILNEAKRWVLVKPKGSGDCGLLLARAANEEQQKCIGNQTGGRVFLFLHTDDIWRDYRNLAAKGVTFATQPGEQPHGIVALFEDLYGNRWDLIQPVKS